VASVEGDIAEVDGVLRITAIRLQYRLSSDAADPEIDRDTVDRALEHYAENCPAYQSIKGCIECSWGLELVRAG